MGSLLITSWGLVRNICMAIIDLIRLIYIPRGLLHQGVKDTLGV